MHETEKNQPAVTASNETDENNAPHNFKFMSIYLPTVAAKPGITLTFSQTKSSNLQARKLVEHELSVLDQLIQTVLALNLDLVILQARLV